MIIELHDKKNGTRIGIDVRQINYFVENFKQNEDGTYSPNEGTAIFVCGNDPFLAKESYEQVKEKIELAGKKH
jgi:hypothetical protein